MTRRDAQRAATVGEIKARALEQIETEGPDALSLNAIAKAMGVTGPALYRYFPSRDALLTDLLVDGYDELATALERAAADTPGTNGPARLRRVASTHRAWARANRSRYLLLFGTPIPGYAAPPERTLPAATRSFVALLRAVDAARGGVARWQPRGAVRAALLEFVPDDPPSAALVALALRAWSRFHGFVSLEITGHFWRLDPALDALFDREIDAFLAELSPTD